METGKARSTAITSGLGKHAMIRIQNVHKEWARMEDVPHSRPPLMNTDEMQEVAFQMLVD